MFMEIYNQIVLMQFFMEYDVRPWGYIQVSDITFPFIVVFVKFRVIYTNLRH